MRTAAAILMLPLAMLLGCATPVAPYGSARVDAGAYPTAFDRTRETLVDLGFTLNRVDAAAGVITTQPLMGRGLAAPWERQQSTLAGELEDAAHTQTRTVRVEFLSPAQAGSLASNDPRTQIDPAPTADPFDPSEPLVARVTVLVERRYRPGLRPQVADVLRSGRTVDPQFEGGSEFGVVIRRDEALEGRIAGRIASKG